MASRPYPPSFAQVPDAPQPVGREFAEPQSAFISSPTMGVFDHDMKSDVVYCSPEVHQIFGWPLDLEVRLEMLSGRAHPDDRAMRDAAIALAHDPSGDGRYSCQYRIVRADGAVRWVHTRSQTFFKGARGARKAARTIGAITDITEARAALALLRDREDRLRRAESLARMGHFSVDPDGGNGVWSTGNKLLFGFDPDANPSFEELMARMHPDDVPRMAAGPRSAARDAQRPGASRRPRDA